MIQAVDGGYVSWMYGSSLTGRKGWAQIRGNYSRWDNTIIFTESKTSRRVDFFERYKANRREKRQQNPEVQRKTELVREFVDDWEYDGSILTHSHPGCEADDLVSLAVVSGLLHPETDIVIGRDKDLLQVHDMNLVDYHQEPVLIEAFWKGLPKTIQNEKYPAKIWIPFLLALLGDKSDGVPRLIPPRRLDLLLDLMNSPLPYSKAYQAFGKVFARNLWLVALPGPWCFKPKPKPKDLPELFDSMEYWRLPINPKVLEPMLDKILRLAVHSPLEDRKIFITRSL